jgi:hypothetical protein
MADVVYAVGKIDLKPLVRSTEEDFVNDFPLNALGAVAFT